MGNLYFTLKKAVKRNAVMTRVIRVFFDAVRNRAKRKMAGYISKNYGHLYEKYNGRTVPPAKTAATYPVWVCWLQGEENMPEAVKMCYQSILKNAGGRRVNLITSGNSSKFVSIPENIREKYKNGIITHTHYSEILRIHLLCEYGGLWIDATTYVSGELPSFDGLSYWTGKWNKGCRFSRSKQFTDFLSYCLPDDVLWSFLKDFYLDFWGKNNRLRAYYILEVAIRCAYENIKPVADAANMVPTTRQGMFDLYSMLNLEYNREKHKALCDEVCFHKLTYKEDFREYTKGGKLTFYGHLYQEYKTSMPKPIEAPIIETPIKYCAAPPDDCTTAVMSPGGAAQHLIGG